MALTLDQVRQVEWGRSYLWEVWFPEITFEPFVAWFPASSVDEPLATIKSQQFTAGAYTFEIPLNWDLGQISVTFFDDSKQQLMRWFRDWMHRITPQSYNGVRTLNEIVKKFHVRRLGLDRKVIDTTVYDVYPDGQLKDSHGSESGPKSFSVTLTVAGRTLSQ